MRKRNCFVCFLCVLLLSVLLTGCTSEEKGKTAEENAAVVQTEAPAEVPSDVPTEQPTTVPTESDPYVMVSTPYGDLYYQDQWADVMITEQVTEGESIVVNFSTEINGTVYPLFTFTIGPGDGTPVGELTDAEGTKREVLARMESIEASAELTEGEQNRLYAMQEEINYVIDNLK